MNDIKDTSDATVELRILLGSFLNEIMRFNTSDMLRLLKREELSMPRIAALNFVERQGSVSISEISACLELSLGNTSMLVDKLVCKGFVTRAEDVHDRRHKLIQLTEKGHALVQDLRAVRLEHVVQRILLLPPDLRNRAIEVFRDLAVQLPEMSIADTTSIQEALKQ